MLRNSLYKAGLSLEEAFFKKMDADLIAQHKRLEQLKKGREALTEISGIQNPCILDKLIELEITPEIFSSIAMVPLIEVAWADGSVDEKERLAVLRGADGFGIHKGSIDSNLLEAWLKQRPPAKLLTAWTHMIEGLCEGLTERERQSLKADIVGRARKVAEAAGGFLGLALKISAKEEAILKKMEKAFSTPRKL